VTSAWWETFQQREPIWTTCSRTDEPLQWVTISVASRATRSKFWVCWHFNKHYLFESWLVQRRRPDTEAFEYTGRLFYLDFSHHFSLEPYRQTAGRSALAAFPLHLRVGGGGPRVLIRWIALNIRVLLAILKKGHWKRFPSTGRHALHMTCCLWHCEMLSWPTGSG
jgi:hypothetical protein